MKRLLFCLQYCAPNLCIWIVSPSLVFLLTQKKNMRGLINQMTCIWGITAEVISRIINTKKFQFLFKTEEALNKVLSRGPWSIMGSDKGNLSPLSIEGNNRIHWSHTCSSCRRWIWGLFDPYWLCVGLGQLEHWQPFAFQT